MVPDQIRQHHLEMVTNAKSQPLSRPPESEPVEGGAQESVRLTQNPGGPNDHWCQRTVTLERGSSINRGHGPGREETWLILVSKRSEAAAD